MRVSGIYGFLQGKYKFLGPPPSSNPVVFFLHSVCLRSFTFKHVSLFKAWSWKKSCCVRGQGKAGDPRGCAVWWGAPACADAGDCGFKDKAGAGWELLGLGTPGGVGR